MSSLVMLILGLLVPTPGFFHDAGDGEADFVTLSRQAAARERLAGVVVESVAPGSPGERAGLQAGDEILSWSCEAFPPALLQPASGFVRSPYDLLPLEIEEAPRRPVTLHGRRGGDQERAWTLTAGEWRVETRPGFPADLAALYFEGKASIAAGDLAAAERSWRSAAASARTAGDGRLAAWFLDRLAKALFEAGKRPEADAAYGEAVEVLEQGSQPSAAAQLLHDWGHTLGRLESWDAAMDRFQKALALVRAATPRGLAEARAINDVGVAFANKGDLSAAETLLRQALALWEELAPGTVQVTTSLNNLGLLAHMRGDLDAAEDSLTRAEELQRRLAPNTADHALFFQNLGNLARERGDLEKSAGLYRQALAIFEKDDPDGDGLTDCLNGLADVMIRRGDLAMADGLLQRALELDQRKAGKELQISRTLLNLGNLAERRGDLAAAEAYNRRAVEMQEKVSPDVPSYGALTNLGILAAQRGDFAAGRSYLKRELAAHERASPGSVDVATTLEYLGRLEMASGDLTTAAEYLRRSLTIYKGKAPESLWISDVLRDLGEVAARRGRRMEALALHRRVLELQRRLAPGTTGEAEALHFLGRAERRAGRNEEGTRDLCQAIDVLDRQRTRLGGTPEARTFFEAAIGDYYSACLEGLVQLGRPAEAFHALERGRARSFLAILAERDLGLSDLTPELAAERRHADADYDRIQSQLASLSAGRDDAEIERLTGELRDLRARQEEIVARIRRESPRSAAVAYPEPLGLAGARAALDPGTVLLEYAVGEETTLLFVVESGGAGLSVHRIAVGAKDLREEVEKFRRLLARPGSGRTELQARGRSLYDLLVRPAESRIAGARRVLVSPDGPLHILPFAALQRHGLYFAEWKPTHTVLSATVYAELTRSRPVRREPGEERLVAFGDPVYPPSATDPHVRELVQRGLDLGPIPASRAEVEAIASLYPGSELYLGRDATEERAKSVGPGARLVHFACHGLLDERFPLNSALALTLPEPPEEGRDNGLLQAWEIFEEVRLDADLVTLSACDTGLGKEAGGEGLIGLVRAFQFAGARSVLASQWSVADDATAELMKRFYGHLRAGKSKDEALRSAQSDLIHGKDFSHPYSWAAFQLTGDWR
ncbi:MAG: CHAT domain-containing protein [Acidobacteriota bacterium]